MSTLCTECDSLKLEFFEALPETVWERDLPVSTSDLLQIGEKRLSKACALCSLIKTISEEAIPDSQLDERNKNGQFQLMKLESYEDHPGTGSSKYDQYRLEASYQGLTTVRLSFEISATRSKPIEGNNRSFLIAKANFRGCSGNSRGPNQSRSTSAGRKHSYEHYEDSSTCGKQKRRLLKLPSAECDTEQLADPTIAGCDQQKLLWDTEQSMIEANQPSKDRVGGTAGPTPRPNDRAWGLNNVATRADSKSVVALARSWISKCTHEHDLCNDRLVHTTNELPSRLLEIDNTKGEFILRLRSREDLCDGQNTGYATLSYCWGSVSFIKTTKESFSRHQKHISLDTLPGTFRDAIKISCGLGINLIWIDALCIIQDDLDDVETECAQMAAIYSSSLVTIVASDSRDCEGGCFIPRHNCSFTCNSTDGTREATITIADRCESWEKAISGPVSMRGWCLQERHLSPRVLHFTTSRILWECRLCFSSEDNPEMVLKMEKGHRGWGKDLGNNSDTIRFANNFWRLLDYGQPNTEYVSVPWSDAREHENGRITQTWTSHVRWQWYQAVEDYSARCLSYPSDKLRAIAGLAAAVWNFVQDDQYCAGIWKDQAFLALAWHAGVEKVSPGPKPISAKNFDADGKDMYIPSWSWASFDGSVEYDDVDWYHKSARRCIIRSMVTTPIGKDTFGPVRRAELIVRAFIREVTVSHTRAAVLNEYTSYLRPALPGAIKCLSISSEVGQHGGFLILDVSLQTLEETSLVCMELGQGGEPKCDREYSPMEYGLLLMKVGRSDYATSDTLETYCRIGTYEANGLGNEQWFSSKQKADIRII